MRLLKLAPLRLESSIPYDDGRTVVGCWRVTTSGAKWIWRALYDTE